jgi:hypothetical protein
MSLSPPFTFTFTMPGHCQKKEIKGNGQIFNSERE